ncbi:MAG: hypothetical protein D6732_06325 [Methanobacteriota archaeon]|nr:MAG: hypothetical protein D6732_06325 [Euryarchaeota archaeon]
MLFIVSRGRKNFEEFLQKNNDLQPIHLILPRHYKEQGIVPAIPLLILNIIFAGIPIGILYAMRNTPPILHPIRILLALTALLVTSVLWWDYLNKNATATGFAIANDKLVKWKWRPGRTSIQEFYLENISHLQKEIVQKDDDFYTSTLNIHYLNPTTTNPTTIMEVNSDDEHIIHRLLQLFSQYGLPINEQVEYFS